jgi:2-polyprenyl-3-methyl-5-hydroxy-6-metoxy-1,4-benzoquinol methylase
MACYVHQHNTRIYVERPSSSEMNESEIIRSTLERPEAHAKWLNAFDVDGSRAFNESAFDHIVQVFGSRTKSTVLDAGCGIGSNTIRLALRGYPVLAMDVSEHILERARANVAASNLSQMVTFERGSVSSLPMHDSSFEFVLCWDVLMYTPEVEKAISELSRVVRPDGFLIFSEDNMWSLEALLVRVARRIVKRKDFARPKISAAGAEYWHRTDAGPLFGRVARISWLVANVASHGFELKERIAGELLYSHVVPGKSLKRCVQKLNLLWFEHVRLPHPAMGNLLIFQKKH